MANPLVSDRDVEFLLYEVLDGAALPTLPAFAAHDRATFELLIDSARRLAREVLYPAYRAMDAEPPRFEGGRIITHPLMKTIYPQLVEFGLIGATRPVAVGGQQLPRLVCTLGAIYLMAGNLSACGYVGLTSAAAHLLESFGSEELQREFMARMYSGQWTGTMALTEPQAGSSLADVKTRATPTAAGHYLIRGSKIFISAGDHDLTENVVHLTLARIEGAPPGSAGISLFAVTTDTPGFSRGRNLHKIGQHAQDTEGVFVGPLGIIDHEYGLLFHYSIIMEMISLLDLFLMKRGSILQTFSLILNIQINPSCHIHTLKTLKF